MEVKFEWSNAKKTLSCKAVNLRKINVNNGLVQQLHESQDEEAEAEGVRGKTTISI